MNSSPPRRATVSPSRTPASRRSATACSSRSPEAVAERVVDDLEAVEIEEEHAQPLLQAMGLRHRDVEAVVEEQPVGQAGEDVVVGQALDLLLGALPLRDVEGDAEHGRPPPELDGAGRGIQPALLAVPALDLELVARGHGLAALAGQAALADRLAEVGVHEPPEAQVPELLAVVAGDGGGGGVRVAEALVLIDEDGAGRGLGQGAEAGLALAQGVGGAAPVEGGGHVLGHEGEDVAVLLRVARRSRSSSGRRSRRRRGRRASGARPASRRRARPPPRPRPWPPGARTRRGRPAGAPPCASRIR